MPIWNFITYAGCTAASVGRAFSRVCLSVCLFVCLRSFWTISTKRGTHVLYNSRSVCIDPEVKRSNVKVTRLGKPSRSHGCLWRLLLRPCAAAAGVGLYVDTTACFLVNYIIPWTRDEQLLNGWPRHSDSGKIL